MLRVFRMRNGSTVVSTVTVSASSCFWGHWGKRSGLFPGSLSLSLHFPNVEQSLSICLELLKTAHTVSRWHWGGT